MSGLSVAVVTACAVSLLGAIVSCFVTDGGTKKIISLVLGAFMMCALIVPVSKAVSEFSVNTDSHPSYESISATADEAYQKQLVSATRTKLKETLTAILNQNNIYPQKVEVILAFADESSIIISQVSIYISNSDISKTAQISRLTEESFQITPDIIRSEDE